MMQLAHCTRPRGPHVIHRVTTTADEIIGSVWFPAGSTEPTQETLDVPIPIRSRFRPATPDQIVVSSERLGASGAHSWRWTGTWRLHLPTLRALRAWFEPTVWVIPLATDGTPGIPVYLMAETLPARATPDAYLSPFDVGPLCALFVPSAEAAIWECGFLLYTKEGLPLPAGFTEASTFDAMAASVMPAITMAAPAEMAPDQTGEVTLSVTRAGLPVPSGTVFLEATAGYLPKRRVQINNGTAQFRFSALGLEAGDEIKLKAGWRYIAAVAETIVRVV